MSWQARAPPPFYLEGHAINHAWPLRSSSPSLPAFQSSIAERSGVWLSLDRCSSFSRDTNVRILSRAARYVAPGNGVISRHPRPDLMCALFVILVDDCALIKHHVYTNSGGGGGTVSSYSLGIASILELFYEVAPPRPLAI